MKAYKNIANRKTIVSTLLALLAFMPACTSPKSGPRDVHDAKLAEWHPTTTPVDNSVDAKAFRSFDIKKGFAKLENVQTDLVSDILVPLSDIILNGKFIGNPDYHTIRMEQMLQVFDQAMLHQLDKGDTSAKFSQIKTRYYEAVFAGCTRDLKSDCANAAFFASDARATRILTAFARELDPQIDAEINENKTSEGCVNNSQNCRNLLEKRYNILAMGLYHHSNRNDDQEYTFAYLKYARPFALLMNYEKQQHALQAKSGQVPTRDLSLSYLSETHGKIFETLIAQYAPKDLNNKEFRAFVENFNPWVYSEKKADLFQYGTRTMFELGAKCCLYVDKEKTTLSPAVKKAIKDSQLNKDEFGPSLSQMLTTIRARYGDQDFNDLVKNLGIQDLTAKVENLDSDFYNESFFIVDRLFRENLSSAEVDKVLENANSDRMQTELPKMVSNYIKINLLYMVADTNDFMKKIYNSNISSGDVFNTAVTRSRELTTRWHKVQAQIDLLDGLMGSYFKTRGIEPDEYLKTVKLIGAVDRNIHYLSVYPNMLVMNYFLAKMDGVIVVNSWWGKIEIQASTVIQNFLDGDIQDPWFRFGKDVEPLNRQMLLYSMDFLLSTKTLNAFVAKDQVGTGGSDRAKFFDLIFTKYLGADVRNIGESVLAYERETISDPSFAFVNQVCDYELKPQASGIAPQVEMSLLDLRNYTYSGIGGNSVNDLLNKFLGDAGDTADQIRQNADSRINYIKAIVDIIDADLVRSGQIKKAGDPHPDTAKARALIAQLEALKARVGKLFVQNHKRYFNCLMTLQEVERRRTNRLYEEERAYLGQIYDMMTPFASLQDGSSLDAAVKKINDSYFRNPQNGIRFDRFDGLSYRMSKYDLLMRMKKRIESDIFTRPTDREMRVYGESEKTFNKPRSVTVDIPAGLDRDDMVSQGTSISLYYHGDKQDFIRQGMKVFSGGSDTFIQWQGQMTNDDKLRNYMNSLEEFYLLGPIKDGSSVYQVTKEDLVKAYVDVWSSYTMNEFDVQNATDFNIDGRFSKSFYEDNFIQKDGQTRLPFFRRLMLKVYDLSAVKIGDKGPITDALNFASVINNLGTFVFEPSQQVASSVKTIYGQNARARYKMVVDLFQYIKKLEIAHPDVVSLDPRLARPFYLNSGAPMIWRQANAANLYDPRPMDDLKSDVKLFYQKSGDFYRTAKKAGAQ